MTYTKLTFKEYSKLSIRTLPVLSKVHYKGVKRVLSNNVESSVILDRLHCAVGVVTETYELINAINKKDSVNIGEELADKLWYLSALIYIDNNYQTLKDRSFDNIFREFNLKQVKFSLPVRLFSQFFKKTTINEILKYDEKFLDSGKKEFAYLKTNTIDLRSIILYIKLIYRIASIYNIDIESHMAKNINKLVERFGDKFDADAAINRDHDKERKILEK